MSSLTGIPTSHNDHKKCFCQTIKIIIKNLTPHGTQFLNSKAQVFVEMIDEWLITYIDVKCLWFHFWMDEK